MSTFGNNTRQIVTIAVSRIKVYESKGAAPDLQTSLQAIAGSLKARPGCLAYDVSQSDHEVGIWLVTGQWNSLEAMEDHYQDPALNGFSDLVQSNAVSRLDFSSKQM